MVRNIEKIDECQQVCMFARWLGQAIFSEKSPCRPASPRRSSFLVFDAEAESSLKGLHHERSINSHRFSQRRRIGHRASYRPPTRRSSPAFSECLAMSSPRPRNNSPPPCPMPLGPCPLVASPKHQRSLRASHSSSRTTRDSSPASARLSTADSSSSSPSPNR